MKKSMLVLLVLVLLCTGSLDAFAQVAQRPELDAAFSMLEEGNPILNKYNELTGAGIEARYKYGMPYFFGGNNPNYWFKLKRPLETTRYYNKKKTYIYGFDCSGFTKWINKQSGKPAHPPLSDMIMHYYEYRNNQLPVKKLPFQELHNHLQVGDFVVGKHRARHILMYIGTLADYGYTAETAPQLADYLDYPLAIQCGKDPFHTEWYTKYIEENGLKATPTDGGVCISIIGAPVDKAPYNVVSNNEKFYYFDLEGYKLTIWDITTCSSYVWFRML